MCTSDFSVTHGAENDINRHKDTSNHKGYVDVAQQQRKLTNFDTSSETANIGQKLVKAELIFSSFWLNTTSLSVLQITLLNYSEHSKIVNKYRCGWTKTTHMLTGAVPKQTTSDLNEELLLTRWYGLATDGSSDEDDKFLPVLVRLVDKDSTLIPTSLLEMVNMKIDSIPQQMYDVCNEVREAFSLDWDNCLMYSSDNANSMNKRFLTLVGLVI